MESHKAENCDESSKFVRIAQRIVCAASVIADEGGGVLIKWDGDRDSQNIYTVVRERAGGTGELFRIDAGDLGMALSRIFPSVFHVPSDVELCIVNAIVVIDRAARRGMIINLRIIKIKDATNFHIVVLDPKQKKVIFDCHGDNMNSVLEKTVCFIEDVYRY